MKSETYAKKTTDLFTSTVYTPFSFSLGIGCDCGILTSLSRTLGSEIDTAPGINLAAYNFFFYQSFNLFYQFRHCSDFSEICTSFFFIKHRATFIPDTKVSS